MTDILLTHLHQGILTLTLNRPHVRNAMSLAMVSALRRSLKDAQDNSDVRILVLRGAGDHFCAGGDLKDMAIARKTPTKKSHDPIQTLNASFGHLANAFAQSPLPVVAVLQGAVMGGGFGLACVADIVIASTTTIFRLPETSLGVIPAQIAPFLVQRLGFSEAKRLALTGAKLNATQALTCGLVHEVCPPEQLNTALHTVLQQLINCAPGATAVTKKLFFDMLNTSDADIDHAASLFADAVRGSEATEGVSAFLGKRRPTWHSTLEDL